MHCHGGTHIGNFLNLEGLGGPTKFGLKVVIGTCHPFGKFVVKVVWPFIYLLKVLYNKYIRTNMAPKFANQT
jgi:hypothetical protein